MAHRFKLDCCVFRKAGVISHQHHSLRSRVLSFLLQKILVCKCVRAWERDFMYKPEQNKSVINNRQNNFGKGIY